MLLELVTALAPYLRSSRAGDVEMRDRGPLGEEPVRLLLPADSFEFADCTEGQAAHGQYTATTRHGLVRIDKDGQHVGTVKQGRWGLLTAAYEAERRRS